MTRTRHRREPVEPKDESITCPVLIQPRDPLVFRDARPFSAEPGARAFCLPFPFPRTVAGALRTHIGNAANARIDWQKREETRTASQIVVHGPLLVGKQPSDSTWQVHVPAPQDVVFHRNESKQLHGMILRPRSLDPNGNDGCNFPVKPTGEPATGYERAMKNTDLGPMTITEDVKPEKDVPAWWRIDDALRWLGTVDGQEQDLPFTDPDPVTRSVRGMAGLSHDTRTHVGIDPETLTNREGALFTTESLVFPEKQTTPGSDGKTTPAAAMLCRVESNIPWKRDAVVAPLGGERRLARFQFDDHGVKWPEMILPADEEFEAANGLRLLLVTPAIFSHGWLPAWMADATIPGLAELGVPVTLAGAAIERRIPVSGWQITRKDGANGKEAGARGTRYAVPAGGVYFFRFTRGKPTAELWETIWNRLWLRPISDRQIDRESGFGMVLPGVWRA